MRTLLYKNLTSTDRKRRILVNTEQVDKSGIRTQIIRHLICLVKEIEPQRVIEQSSPSLYVIKERNHKEQRQRFFCRIKGNICTISNGRLYLITFIHSLKINLKVLLEEPVDYPEGDE